MNFDELDAAIENLKELRERILSIEPTRQQAKLLDTAFTGIKNAEEALRGFAASLLAEVTE
jgi:hypothetical protein